MNSEDFNIKTGVRQGDLLSPLLFIIFMDKCMKDIGVGERGEETFVYADDVAVVSEHAVDLQNIVDAWNLAMTQNGM